MAIFIFSFAIVTSLILYLSVQNVSNYNSSIRNKIIVGLIYIICTSATYVRCENTMQSIGAITIIAILIYASIADITNRIIPDYVFILIAVASLIGKNIDKLPQMLICAAAIFAIQLILVVFSNKKLPIGGADIKISTACAFALGTHIFAAYFAAVLLAIVGCIIFSITKKVKIKSFPFIPYLSIGFALTYLMEVNL